MITPTGTPISRRTLISLTAAAAGATLAGCANGRSTPTKTGNQPAAELSTGITLVPKTERTPTPEVSGRRLGSLNDTLTLADYRGKIIVLNVWGSWCGPCRKEAPDLEAAWQATKPQAQFIGINTRDSTPSQAEAFVRAFKITYPHIYDPPGKTLAQFNAYLPISAIPSTLIIDKQYRVAARIIGTVTKTTLIDIIDEIAGPA